MFANTPPFNYFGNNVKIYAYLYDREFNAPGAREDIIDEAKKIPLYVKRGDLNSNSGPNIILK